MLTFNVHEAEAHLPCVLQAVEAGDEMMIARAGRPVARLVRAAARVSTLEPLHPDPFDRPLT